MTSSESRIGTSERVAQLVQSDIRAMTQKCHELGGVNLGQGICDTPPPQVILDGLAPAAARGHNTYTRYDGVDRLRRALSTKLARYNGIDADPDVNILATAGSTGAFTVTLTALCNPGDRIILLEPYYGYHLNTARVAGLDPVLVPLNPEDFSLDMDALERAARTAKVLVLNTPGNPSGRVFTQSEMAALADLCRKYDLLCITDEIYEYFLFDGRKHISMATLPGMWERTVTMGGYSKTFSITGWRMGYLVAPKALAEPIGLVNDLFYVCVAAPVQEAVTDAIEQLDDRFYQRLAQDHQHKRDRFCDALASVGLEPRHPEGAYYVLADASRLGAETSREAAFRLLERTGLAGVPGSAFFASDQSRDGRQWIRFCFGKDDATLTRAIECLHAL